MIELDGSNAGGQFVRTAVALSTVTGKAVKITNIRGARPQPGLKRQHMEGIRSLGKICNARIVGLEPDSKELEYIPSKFNPKDITIDISTAGSIGLILQALLIATSQTTKKFKVTINGGGTWNKWAPPVLYIQNVLMPLIGDKSEIKILTEGFYPKGGAKVIIDIEPFEIKEINITEKGKLEKVYGSSVASYILENKKVAERQAEAAEKKIKEKLETEPVIGTKYLRTESVGTGVFLYAKTENSIIGADNLGEIQKKAEVVGKEAAEDLIKEYNSGAVDRHAADMLLPYMALKESGKIQASQITHHIKMNIFVIEKFLPVKFEIDEEKRIITCSKI